MDGLDPEDARKELRSLIKPSACGFPWLGTVQSGNKQANQRFNIK